MQWSFCCSFFWRNSLGATQKVLYKLKFVTFCIWDELNDDSVYVNVNIGNLCQIVGRLWSKEKHVPVTIFKGLLSQKS